MSNLPPLFTGFRRFCLFPGFFLCLQHKMQRGSHQPGTQEIGSSQKQVGYPELALLTFLAFFLAFFNSFFCAFRSFLRSFSDNRGGGGSC